MADNTILFEGDTEFNHYEVADTIYGGRPARVLYSGNHEAAQSGIARDDNPDLLFDYNQRFMELIRGLRPKSLLLIGGGAFTLPIALMKEFPDMAVDVVELDGGLVDIARDYFDFRPSPNIQVHIGGGRQFIDSTGNKYDLLLVDVFTNASLPSSFQTLEAAQSLKSRLNKNGVLAVNIISALRGRQAGVLDRLYETLQATFPEVKIFPASYGQTPWLRQNFIMTAQTANRDISSAMRYPATDIET
jgi:spermidine synthase